MSINIKPQKEHSYTLRSCNNCKNLAACNEKWKRDERMTWADCAKYGCARYSGVFDTEKRQGDKPKQRKTATGQRCK